MRPVDSMEKNQISRFLSSPFMGVIGASCLLTFGVLTFGCQGQKYTLVPVKGVIKINGSPAANVRVQVMPDITENATGPTSSGVSGPNGEFELMTMDDKPRPGAVVGKHIAVFFDLEEDRPAQGEPSVRPPRFPSQFGTAAGGIKVEIKPGQDLDLNIVTR